ncbi:MAG TPA: tetratricopeptide repeat protein, partial [Bacteroidales bacterium]|nr:tetratricopeptide repeat protein [Bacteroidales bacterium]
LNFHQLAIEKCQEIGDSMLLASAYNNMGATCFENKLYGEALSCFENAHDIYRVKNDTLNLGRVYNSLGIIHGQLNNLIEAKRYFLKAIYIFEHREMFSSVASIENNLAKLYIKSGDYKTAEEYIAKSYAYSSNKDIVQLQLNNFRVSVDLYKKQNNYKRAFENLEKFISLHDSIKNETIIKKVEQIRMAYEVDKMEKDLMLAKKDNQLKSKNLRVSLFLSLGIFIIGILLIIVLIIKNRQSASKLLISQREKEITDLKISKVEDEKRLAKEKFEMELTFKNRELTTTTMHIVQKNELINSIRNHLSKMELASKANEKVVSDIIAEIDQNIIKDKDWELFVKHFKDVHPDFFDNLLKRHPDLTSKEVRYCAYFRLNLSLKEISAVLNITTRGVEKARSRIRQKMNLSKEIDLNTYIHSLDI